jgi:uncharacterized protein
MSDKRRLRLAVIAALVDAAPGILGRTALMKLTYALQTVFNVPLGYDFKIYTYGPFDAQVLEDLAYAERLGAIDCSAVHYADGYRYILRPGAKIQEVEQLGAPELDGHRKTIVRVVQQFGSRTAGDLEMIGTIIFVDRAYRKKGETVPLRQLAERVRSIKPRLELGQVEAEAARLKDSRYLTAVQ